MRELFGKILKGIGKAFLAVGEALSLTSNSSVTIVLLFFAYVLFKGLGLNTKEATDIISTLSNMILVWAVFYIVVAIILAGWMLTSKNGKSKAEYLLKIGIGGLAVFSFVWGGWLSAESEILPKIVVIIFVIIFVVIGYLDVKNEVNEQGVKCRRSDDKDTHASIFSIFPPGIQYRIKILSFLDDGPKSLADFKDEFKDEWGTISRYLREALLAGLVTIQVEHHVKTKDEVTSMSLWPTEIPERVLMTINLLLVTPPGKSISAGIKESDVFFYLTEKGLGLLIEYRSKRYWKWWTLVSVVIALTSLIVSVISILR